MAQKITAAQKQQMMTQFLASAQGRQRLAAQLINPLRELRDYVSIGRKLFQIDELPDGALPIYEKDINTPAYIVAEEGDSVEEVVKGTRILVPLFEIASYQTIPFTQVKERRFDIVSRIKKKAIDELFRLEDRKIFATLEYATSSANTTNVPVVGAGANPTPAELADVFALVERHGLIVDKVLMNASQFKAFRTWNTTSHSEIIDFETSRELLKTGLMGTLWGAAIYVSPEIPTNRVYVVTSPDYLAVMPQRIDLTVLPADKPEYRSYGWSIFESIGIAIYNAKGCAAWTDGNDPVYVNQFNKAGLGPVGQ